MKISFPLTRLPIKGTRTEQMIADNEIGLHRDDAIRLGISRWAFLNYTGIPAVCRVRLLHSPDDLGFVRLPLYARLLMGIQSWSPGLRPEILVSAYPEDRHGNPLLVEGIPRSPGRAQRITASCGTWADRVATSLLRAPDAVLRIAEATPGEDQALTVRLPAELFPLLGTVPGKQVYVEWGPGNRAIATALAMSETDIGELPDFQIVGDRLAHTSPLPDFAQLKAGAATRATLGIPRIAVVTIRRRVIPLIIDRLNQLIVPVTGLFIGISANMKINIWVLLLAAVIIAALLLIPLRVKRPDLRRVK